MVCDFNASKNQLFIKEAINLIISNLKLCSLDSKWSYLIKLKFLSKNRRFQNYKLVYLFMLIY